VVKLELIGYRPNDARKLLARQQKNVGAKKVSKDITKIADDIAIERDADIFILNGGISPKLEGRVCSELQKRIKRRNVIVLIVTEGGSADAGFRIGRHFQENYEKLTAVVAGWCKSAGTLICIASDKIVIGNSGELGPLDVQLAKPDDLGGLASGLTLDSAFRSLRTISFELFESFLVETIRKSGGRITTKTAAELAVQLTVGMMSPIFQQIDPLKLGEDYRATRIAEQYAERLNIKAQNLKSDTSFDALEALVRGYPSHRFVIDRTEAGTLFQRVDALDGDLAKLVEGLAPLTMEPLSQAKGQKEVAVYVNQEPIHEVQSDATSSESPNGSRDGNSKQDGSVQSNSKKGHRNIAVSKNGNGSKKQAFKSD